MHKIPDPYYREIIFSLIEMEPDFYDASADIVDFPTQEDKRQAKSRRKIEDLVIERQLQQQLSL